MSRKILLALMLASSVSSANADQLRSPPGITGERMAAIVAVGTGVLAQEATLANKCGLRDSKWLDRLLRSAERTAVQARTGNGGTNEAAWWARGMTVYGTMAGNREFDAYGTTACRRLERSGMMQTLDEWARTSTP